MPDQRTQDLIGSLGEAHQRTENDAADSTQAEAAQNTQHTDAQVLCHLTAGAERNEGRQRPPGRRQNTGTDQSQIGTECPDQQNSQRSNHRQEELVRTVACQHSLIFFHKITTPSVDQNFQLSSSAAVSWRTLCSHAGSSFQARTLSTASPSGTSG